MSKPAYACLMHGPLAPDLVIRDHKRPRCALCGAEATPTVRAMRLEARPVTPEEREFMVRSIVSSQALSGVHVPRDVAERIFDEVAAEPLIDLEVRAVPPGIVSSRTWAPDGNVWGIDRLAMELRRERDV